MRVLIQDVVQCVIGLVAPGRSVLVGIDGGAGAGKTTFTRWFADRIRESVAPVSVVHTDLIYRPVAERWTGSIEGMPIGYDLDWERLRDQVILPLRAGRTACFQLYDWVADRLNDWVRIDVGGVTIIDGVLALRNELADHYDLRLWFSCPREVRVPRLLNRGDTPQAELEYWLPIEERYIAAQTPEKSAHLVVDGAADMSTDDEGGWFEAIRWSPPRVARQAHRGDTWPGARKVSSVHEAAMDWVENTEEKVICAVKKRCSSSSSTLPAITTISARWS